MQFKSGTKFHPPQLLTFRFNTTNFALDCRQMCELLQTHTRFRRQLWLPPWSLFFIGEKKTVLYLNQRNFPSAIVVTQNVESGCDLTGWLPSSNWLSVLHFYAGINKMALILSAKVDTNIISWSVDEHCGGTLHSSSSSGLFLFVQPGFSKLPESRRDTAVSPHPFIFSIIPIRTSTWIINPANPNGFHQHFWNWLGWQVCLPHWRSLAARCHFWSLWVMSWLFAGQDNFWHWNSATFENKLEKLMMPVRLCDNLGRSAFCGEAPISLAVNEGGSLSNAGLLLPFTRTQQKNKLWQKP